MTLRGNGQRRRTRHAAYALACTVALALAAPCAACSGSSTAPGDAGGDTGLDAQSVAEGGTPDAGAGDGRHTDGGATDAGVLPDAHVDSGAAAGFPCGIALGEDGFDQVRALGADAEGNVYFGGRLRSAMFGGMRLMPEWPSGYVASITTDCEARWAQLLPEQITDVAVAADGDTFALAEFGRGTAEVGDRVLHADDSTDLYVVKLDRNGNIEWVRQLGADRPGGIALAPGGQAVVSGGFRDTDDFGGTELTAGGAFDAFVARLAADGTVRWVRQLVGLTFAHAADVATDEEGNAYAVGEIGEGIDLGAVVHEPPGDTGGFIVSLDPAGNHRWSDAMGSAGSSGLLNVATGAGRVGIAGWHDAIVYLAQRATDGTPLWSRSVQGRVAIPGTAIDRSARMWVWMGARVLFEEEAVDSDGMLLAVFDREGGLAATRLGEDAGSFHVKGSALAFNADETRGYVAGRLDYEVTFGSVSLTGHIADGFVIGFEPSSVLSP